MEPRALKYIADACAGELRNGVPEKMVSRICTDSRQAQDGDLFFALAGERFDAHAFLPEVAKRGVAAVVAERTKTPADFAGCPVLLVDNTRTALGGLAARYRNDFDLPIVAVGGSNGKTTTKELIASVLRQKKATLWSEASFNNDIGVPLTLLKLERIHKAAVLEVGTNHPGELAPLLQMIRPRLGVVTNIGREHLEFFGDVAGVAQEEGAMGEALSADGVLFVNGDSEWADVLVRRTTARVVRVGLGERNDVRGENLRTDENGVAFMVKSPSEKLTGEYRIKLLGRHQVVNALFAFAVGAELNLSRESIARGLADCAPAKMRMQFWKSAAGVGVLEDCYNANADSMLAALQTLKEMPSRGRRIAVLGDMAELGAQSIEAHREVGTQAAQSVDSLFAIGERARDIADAARKSGLREIGESLDVESAAQEIRKLVRGGDVVLIKASRAMRLERVSEALKASEK